MTDPAPQGPAGHPHFSGPNVPPQQAGRRWLHLLGDIGLAIGLLVLDAVAAIVAFLLGIDYDGWKPFDPGADNSDVVLTPEWWYVGVVGGAILMSAPLLYLLRALVGTCTQVLVGFIVVVVAVGGAQVDRGNRPGPSASGYSPASLR